MLTIIFRYIPYSAMALYPFIVVKHAKLRENRVLINHELIHLRQQAELLILPFYFLYVVNYVINLVRFKNHDKAYREIVFEQEAYAMDNDLQYLANRKWFAFTTWLKS